VQVQSEPAGSQVMPTTLQAERSGGAAVGQSLGDQQAHAIVSSMQSHTRVPNVQLPRAGVQLPVASASVIGHIWVRNKPCPGLLPLAPARLGPVPERPALALAVLAPVSLERSSPPQASNPNPMSANVT